MARPANAVLFVVEKFVDDFFVGVGACVVEEFVLLLRRGRKAGEIEVDAAEEGEFIGGRIGFEAFGGAFGGEVGVDRFRLCFIERLQRPELELGRLGGEREGGDCQEGEFHGVPRFDLLSNDSQFSITVNGGSELRSGSATRKRWPSGVTS